MSTCIYTYASSFLCCDVFCLFVHVCICFSVCTSMSMSVCMCVCSADARERMVMLADKDEKDAQQHNAELRELLRVIDDDRKLHDFMSIKKRERTDDELMAEWRQRKGKQAITSRDYQNNN